MQMTQVDRRTILKMLAVTAAASSTARQAQGQEAAAPTGAFQHGVASGDPNGSSVVLWTRLTTDQPGASVQWQLAADPDFASVVAEGEAMAAVERDFTVKVIPEGLEAGATYYYRFTAAGETSPTGRTKTLPDGPLDRLGIAIASCSNYPLGHFNAYDAMARDDEVDFVFHTGDYIYEYSTEGWGDPIATQLGRQSLPDKEIVSLADYRQRHAQYKSDTALQAVHAAHPFVTCWDDHEVTNNPWTGGAGNHQPETEGDWETRRAAGLQAYFEWMPVRDQAPGQALGDYWRTYRFGDLATMVILETRHSGRDEQPRYATEDELSTPEDRERYGAEVLGDPSRRMLRPEMEAHLREGIESSLEAGQPWRLIGTASPITRFHIPDIGALGVDESELSDGLKYLAFHGRWDLPWYNDTWDGYPVAREDFYTLCREAGAQDLLVLTGDTHQFWATELADAEGRPMGVELGTAGISSPSEYIDTGLDPEVGRRLDAIYTEHMPEVHWTDGLHNGYIRVVLSPDEAVATVVAVDTVMSTAYATADLFRERIVKSGPSLTYAAA